MSDGFCGTHLQIMVRTRGLGRALGQVTGRGVGRGDHDDSDDVPQRQQPTASARRQRVAVTAAHDETNVQDDPMEAPAVVEDIVADIPADTGAEAAEDEDEGFPGGPSDPSVLIQYADHVAYSIWTGERPELKLSSHGRKVHSLGRPVPAIKGLVAGTGLSPLIACSVDTGDRGLLSAFVERWHQETSSFHLPVGELTITLNDVSSLLHLPVIGDLHAFEPLHVDDAVQMLVDLLMVSAESARAETAQCRGPYVRLQWVRDIYERRCQEGHWTAAARTYLLHLLGCTLFANKSATNVHVVYLEALRDLSMTERYAWGVAALCWIYEHFPSVADSTADQEYDEDSPRACRWIATKKTVKSIRSAWTDSEFRMSVGSLMGSTGRSGTSMSDHAIPVSCAGGLLLFITDRRGSCGSLATCRPFLLLLSIHGSRMMIYTIGGCTTRIISFQQILCLMVMPRSPKSSLRPRRRISLTCRSQEHRRHLRRSLDMQWLERHLSLGVVTPGSLTHEVIEECLRLARSVTQDHLVYVRSRCRRRTDQACIQCWCPVKTLYVQYSPGNIRLMKCENCKAVADEYIECEIMILVIDLILHKPKAYRHLLHNVINQETMKFHVLMDVIIGNLMFLLTFFFMVKMFFHVWDFPSSVIFIIELFCLSSNAAALKVMTESTMRRCVWTCFSAYAIKFIVTRILELILLGQLMQGWSQMPFTFSKATMI
ncbi:Protein MAIN-LIKE 1 [Glycine soja]